jgi:hypothetical protein
MSIIDSGIEIKNLVKVEALPDYQLYIEFEDGIAGTVDISDIVGRGPVFAPLKDPDMFSQVRLDKELGAPCWPNGADLAPDRLYRDLAN